MHLKVTHTLMAAFTVNKIALVGADAILMYEDLSKKKKRIKNK